MTYRVLLESGNTIQADGSVRIRATGGALGVSRHLYLGGWTIDHISCGASIIPASHDDKTFPTRAAARSAAIGFWERLSKRDRYIMSDRNLAYDDFKAKGVKASRAIKYLMAMLDLTPTPACELPNRTSR